MVFALSDIPASYEFETLVCRAHSRRTGGAEAERLSDSTVRNGYASGMETAPDQGALTGAMISGVFGLAWTEWGASGISGAVSTAVRIVGIVVSLVIVFWSAHMRRSAREHGSGNMFSSPSYRRVVVPEVVALFGGAALLGATGHHEYVIAWFATVVGVHFLAFGRLFFAGFYWLGTALIAAGIAGAVVGLAGGGLGGVEVTTGLIAAASLFAAGGSTVARARASSHV